MNSRKVLIYFALVFLCFSLWNAWSQFQQKQKEPVSKAAVTAAVENEEQVRPENIVRVETPQQVVFIDRVGGKVIRTSLKQYTLVKGEPKLVNMLSSSSASPFFARVGVSGDASLVYQAKQKEYYFDGNGSFEMVAEAKGVTYRKTFVFDQPCQVEIKTTVVNNGSKAWYGHAYVGFLASNHSQMQGNKPSPQPKDFRAGEMPSNEKSGFFGVNTYMGAAYFDNSTPYNRLPYDQIATTGLGKKVTDGWIAVQKRYFLAALVPQKGHKYDLRSQWSEGYSTKNEHDFIQQFKLMMTGSSQSLAVGEQTTFSARLYAGPELVAPLAALATGLDKTVDYGYLWFISEWLFWLMEKIHELVHNWGVTIVLITFLVKLAFYNLQERANQSMLKMKRLQPMIDNIQKQYENDPEAKHKAIMAFFQKEKLNPLGGCLPLLLQIPFFFALYHVLMEAVQLRHAAFLWIDDLSAVDPFFIIPVLLFLTMLIQVRMSPQPSDPIQARMTLVMPVMFAGMFTQMPSGMGLYVLTQTTLTILQQYRSSLRG